MIGDAFYSLFTVILSIMPVLSLPLGIYDAFEFLSSIMGYIRYFLPVGRLLPIIAFIISIRNWNIILSVINWIVRLIPFVG